MDSPIKILVVRVGRAGDLVMITPALNLILEGYPEAEVHLLTSQDGRRTLQDYHPRLTRYFLYSRRIPATWWSSPPLLRELRQQNYDRVFLFETNAHYRRLLAGVAPQMHIVQNLQPDVHYCVRCLEAVETTLTSPWTRGGLTLPVAEAGRIKAREQLARHGIGDETFLIGLHPTFSGLSHPFFRRGNVKNRSWPQASFARLARMIAGYGKTTALEIQIIVDILPGEKKFIEALVRESQGTVTVLSAPPDFERYKAVIERMALLVTPNTGPMHIAAAVGAPVVALFSGSSPLDCGPFVAPDRCRVLRAEDAADPAKGLAAISPEAVFDACLHFLPGSSHP
ncbi:MAG: glycosyltransferase family 9 protein [Nitrospinaceae bacterium]